MGLDMTHNCWHGPYSAFMRWRRAVAHAAGLPPLDLMEGFFQRGTPGDPISDFAKLCPGLADQIYRSLPIAWGCLKPSPLYVLLHHSDCDGEIATQDCEPLADALEQLLPNIVNDEERQDWRARTEQFIKGLRAAAALGEMVEFY